MRELRELEEEQGGGVAAGGRGDLGRVVVVGGGIIIIVIGVDIVGGSFGGHLIVRVVGVGRDAIVVVVVAADVSGANLVLVLDCVEPDFHDAERVSSTVVNLQRLCSCHGCRGSIVLSVCIISTVISTVISRQLISAFIFEEYDASIFTRSLYRYARNDACSISLSVLAGEDLGQDYSIPRAATGA